MKKKLFSTLVFLSLVMVMSANQTRSQKQVDQDTIPAKVIVDSVRTSVTNSVLLDSLSIKLDQIAEKVEKNTERGDRIENKVDNIRVRQVKIRLALMPVKVEPYQIRPVAYQALPIRVDSVVIRPIEMHKRSWWERKFRHQ